MTTGNEFRLKKLRELVGDDFRAFARQHEGVDGNHLWQMLNNKRSFGERAARNFAAKCGLPEDYFKDKQLNDQQKILFASCKHFSEEQLAELIQAAGYIGRGIHLKPDYESSVATEGSSRPMHEKLNPTTTGMVEKQQDAGEPFVSTTKTKKQKSGDGRAAKAGSSPPEKTT